MFFFSYISLYLYVIFDNKKTIYRFLKIKSPFKVENNFAQFNSYYCRTAVRAFALIETRENGSRTKGEISKIALYGDCLSRVLFRGNWNRYLSRYWLTQTVSLIVIFLLYHHSWLNNTVSSDWAGVKFPLSFEREIVKWLFSMSNKFLVWNPFPKKWNFSILKNTHTLFLFFFL